MTRQAPASRFTPMIALALTMATCLIAQVELLPRDPIDDDPRPDPIQCSSLPNDVPCPDREDQSGDCTTPLCRSGRCVEIPVAGGTPCRDTDGDPFTLARCEAGSGSCNQRSGTRPRFTSDVPADVEVVALTGEPLARPQTFIDCCAICQEQRLEALRPPDRLPACVGGTDDEPGVNCCSDSAPNCPGGRWDRLDVGEPARRTKYCGRVISYDVNDECADPRDMTLDIEPASGFDGFVEGFGKTSCGLERPCIHAEVTPAQQFFEEDDAFLPISGGGRCDGGSCLGGGGGDCVSRLESEREEVCVYGVYAFDHGSHMPALHADLTEVFDQSHDTPEIHPFDTIWWAHPGGNGYRFAVFQDDSNRYSHPYCGGQNNASGWSQAPRDLRFRFPFSFPLSEAPIRADVGRVRTRDFDGRANVVLPLNVSTAFYTAPEEGPDNRRFVSEGRVLLEVVEEEGTDRDTEVGIEATVQGGQVEGSVILRVAVGCDPRDPRTSCSSASLRGASPRGRQDAGDPGSGYFYGELLFRSAPSSSLIVGLRVSPPTDPGRFDIRIDGAVRASRVGNGGSTRRLELPPGSHRVSLAAAPGTVLGNYQVGFSGVCSGGGRLDLVLGEDSSCTLIARRRPDPSDTDRCLNGCDAEFQACKDGGQDPLAVCVALQRDCEDGCR